MPYRRLLLIVLLLGLAAPAAAQAKPPKVLTQQPGHLFQVRPAWISYTGDGTGFLGGADGSGASDPGHLHWGRYTKREANARGTLWLNTCEPTCADGNFVSRPVRVHVFRPRNGRFTRMTIKYRYRGRRYVDRRATHRLGRGYWVWGIIVGK